MVFRVFFQPCSLEDNNNDALTEILSEHESSIEANSAAMNWLRRYINSIDTTDFFGLDGLLNDQAWLAAHRGWLASDKAWLAAGVKAEEDDNYENTPKNITMVDVANAYFYWAHIADEEYRKEYAEMKIVGELFAQMDALPGDPAVGRIESYPDIDGIKFKYLNEIGGDRIMFHASMPAHHLDHRRAAFWVESCGEKPLVEDTRKGERKQLMIDTLTPRHLEEIMHNDWGAIEEIYNSLPLTATPKFLRTRLQGRTFVITRAARVVLPRLHRLLRELGAKIVKLSKMKDTNVCVVRAAQEPLIYHNLVLRHKPEVSTLFDTIHMATRHMKRIKFELEQKELAVIRKKCRPQS